jgi:hypothetical protein
MPHCQGGKLCVHQTLRAETRSGKHSNRKIQKWHLTVDPTDTYSRPARAQPDTSGFGHTDSARNRFNQNKVSSYDAVTGALVNSSFVSNGSGGLSLQQGIVFGPNGNVFVASFGSKSILQFNGLTGAFINTFVSSNSGGLNLPGGLAFGPDQNLYVASGGTSSVNKYNGTTGAFIGAIAAPSQTTGLRFGPDGNLYVTGNGGGPGGDSVQQFDGTTGAFLKTFVTAGSGGLSDPGDLSFGPNGDLFVPDTNAVLEFSGNTGAFIGEFANSGGLSAASGISFGPAGDLFVASGFTSSVKRYNGTTGAYLGDFVTSGSGGLEFPQYVAFSPAPEPGTFLTVGLLLGARSFFRTRRRAVV